MNLLKLKKVLFWGLHVVIALIFSYFHIFSLAAAFEGCWHECPGMFMIIKNTTRMETSTLGDLPRPFCRRAAVHELQARRLFMKSLQKDSQPEFLLMQWSWKHAWTCLKL
jgi:hypothetical protein